MCRLLLFVAIKVNIFGVQMFKRNKAMKIETHVRPTPPSGSLFQQIVRKVSVTMTAIKESIEDAVTKR